MKLIRDDVVTTTTIFAGPTTVPILKTHNSIPIPAIAGGACAGVLIAIAAVVGWMWWGSCIQREQSKAYKRRMAMRAAAEYRKSVTKRRGGPTVNPLQKTTTAERDRKVLFAPPPPKADDPTGINALKKMAVASLRPPPVAAGSSPRKMFRNTYNPFRPSPLGRNSNPPAVPPVPPLPVIENPPTATSDDVPALTKKPSIISSRSVYSDKSGEPHRLNVSDPSSTSFETASEGPWRWSWSFRGILSATGQQNRLSATSTSLLSQFDDIPGVPIGYAIGGDDPHDTEKVYDIEAGMHNS